MTGTTQLRPLRTGGFAWGQARVRAGVSIRELERLSGVHRSILSMAEHGRLVPTAEEFGKVMAVLDGRATASPPEGATSSG